MTIQHSSEAKKVFVAFHLKNIMRDIEPYLEEYFLSETALKTTDWLVIVVKDEMNDSMRETIQMKQRQAWDNHGFFVTILTLPRLQFNILSHKMVPSHSILPVKQKDEVVTRFCIRNIMEEFPTISRFDPVAQVIGIRPEQVCHIVRPSRTAITSDYYRVCINT